MRLFDEAIVLAVRAHSGQHRKGTGLPYIIHPLEAAAIAATLTEDEEILAAAVLHDTVEDTDTTIEEIEARFGLRVAALVASETENKYPGRPKSETWRLRKEESLAALAKATDPGVKLLWLGDKLSNMRSLYRGWEISGDAIWRNFNQKDPAQQAWYYRALTAALSELKGYEAWQELNELVETVFKGAD